MKKITAFSVHQTGIGQQVAFTYSEIDENTGKVLEQNKRAEIVILDNRVKEAVNIIYDFLESKISDY